MSNKVEGQSNSTSSRAPAMNVANTDSIVSIPYGPLSSPGSLNTDAGVNPEHGYLWSQNKTIEQFFLKNEMDLKKLE